jgi:uncharacterized membrane protein
MKPINEKQDEIASGLQQKTMAGQNQAKVAERWAAMIGILAIGVLYAFLPEHLVVGPSWLLLAIEAVLLLPLIVSKLAGRRLPHITLRILAVILLGVITLALAVSIILLVITLSNNKHPATLLRSSVLLWIFNILVFALWYWEIDGGGPVKRHLAGYQAADFMFPQQAKGNDGSWAPHFLDYLFVAFTGATALSPTDTYPLTRAAKALMMMEAMLSLTIIVLLVARAINILGS